MAQDGPGREMQDAKKSRTRPEPSSLQTWINAEEGEPPKGQVEIWMIDCVLLFGFVFVFF